MNSVIQRSTMRSRISLAFILSVVLSSCGRDSAPPPSTLAPTDPPQSSPPVDSAATLELAVVATNLENPCGIAVQPDSGHVFVSMKERVIRLVPGDSYARSDAINDFPTDSYGKGPSYEIGPLGLAFLDSQTLIVGGGGNLDGEEKVNAYVVHTAPGDAVKSDSTLFSVGPIEPGDDSRMGEGNFYGIAITGSTIFVTCNGDDTKGWISKIELKGTEPGPLTPFIKTKVITGVDAPTGAAITADGKLLVSQLGEINEFPDSLLTFYNPADGTLERKLETGLRDLTAVVYSPKTGKLYGLDFSWAKPEEGGLFHLEITGDKVRAVRLAELDKPTAMAFAPDGTLYISVIGSAAAETDTKPGKLLMATGL